MVGRRNYDQLCGLALALDAVGERWTLLIIRELFLGPARFKDIHDSLPKLTPTLLSARLQQLVEQGIIRQEPVPGDARGRQYALTDLGEELRGPVLGLGKWGLRLVTDEDAEQLPARASWARLAIESMVQGRSLPADVTEQYSFEVDDLRFHIDVKDGIPTVHDGPAPRPALTIRADATTYVRVGAGLLTAMSAMLGQQMKAEGSGDAFMNCATLLDLPVVDGAGSRTRASSVPQTSA